MQAKSSVYIYYKIYCHSFRSKSEWLRALDIAIRHSREPLPYQLVQSISRRSEYEEEEARETAERIRRASQADIIENTQAELMAEKIVRLKDIFKRRRDT